MKFGVILLFCVAIAGVAAQEGVFGGLFKSFGGVIDAKTNFLKTLASTITSPLQVLGNRQTSRSGVSSDLDASCGAASQATSSSEESDESQESDESKIAIPRCRTRLNKLKQLLLKKAANKHRGNQQTIQVSITPPAQTQTITSENVTQDSPPPAALADIPELLKLLSASSSAPASSSSQGVTAELRSSLLKILADKYKETSVHVGQTAVTGNSAQDTVSSQALSDISMLVKLLSAAQATSAPTTSQSTLAASSQANDQVAELRSSLLKLLAEKQEALDTNRPLQVQTIEPAVTSQSQSEMSTILKLLSELQATPAPQATIFAISPPKDQTAELKSSMLKMLAESYTTRDAGRPVHVQTVEAGNVAQGLQTSQTQSEMSMLAKLLSTLQATPAQSVAQQSQGPVTPFNMPQHVQYYNQPAAAPASYNDMVNTWQLQQQGYASQQSQTSLELSDIPMMKNIFGASQITASPTPLCNNQLAELKNLLQKLDSTLTHQSQTAGGYNTCYNEKMSTPSTPTSANQNPIMSNYNQMDFTGRDQMPTAPLEAISPQSSDLSMYSNIPRNLPAFGQMPTMSPQTARAPNYDYIPMNVPRRTEQMPIKPSSRMYPQLSRVPNYTPIYEPRIERMPPKTSATRSPQTARMPSYIPMNFEDTEQVPTVEPPASSQMSREPYYTPMNDPGFERMPTVAPATYRPQTQKVPVYVQVPTSPPPPINPQTAMVSDDTPTTAPDDVQMPTPTTEDTISPETTMIPSNDSSNEETSILSSYTFANLDQLRPLTSLPNPVD